MKSTSRLTVWFCLIGLVSLTLLSCQLMQAVLEEATPTPPPTEAPTQPPPPTETPLPPPTEAPTAIPSPTLPPPPTAVPPTDTPGMAQVTWQNDLGKTATVSISGPVNMTFKVTSKSTYFTEIPPGTYTIKVEVPGFYPSTNMATFIPGPQPYPIFKARP